MDEINLSFKVKDLKKFLETCNDEDEIKVWNGNLLEFSHLAISARKDFQSVTIIY